MKKERVMILGAGVAGLTAAHELLERGYDVTLVDQRGHAGGKARSYMKRPWAPGTSDPIAGAAGMPGEHGFRFFPGFYRHLYETMGRIPRAPAKQGGGSVYENLVPIDEELLAVTGKPAIRVPAAAPARRRSGAGADAGLVDALRGWLQFPKDLLTVGLKRDDVELFAAKLWQFATSSPARREQEYEFLGWREFIESLDRSEEYYWYLASGLTRILVAAKARKASTKTIGNVGLQILMCLTERGNTTDRVLNGPTSEVWFRPWLKHLAHLAAKRRVAFRYLHSTKVTKLELRRGRVHAVELTPVRGESPRRHDELDHVVCALPVEVVARLISEDAALRAAGGEAFAGITELAANNLERMTGMQLYLRHDHAINRGHQILPDSPWGLTSISQRQFWDPGRVNQWLPDGRGLLSIDISSWDLPGVGGIPAAMSCSAPDIYKWTLFQLRGALGFHGLTDDNIVGWHLDANPANPGKNLEPILVNSVGTAALRPRAATTIPNLFLAGDYCRTRTDLACMEGANESAREAVNALLESSQSREDRCKLFDPLDREPRGLKLLQEMDDYRFKRGLPWGGIGFADWVVRAGWLADDVGDILLADDKGTTSMIALTRPGQAIPGGAPAPMPAGPYRRPRDQWDDRGSFLQGSEASDYQREAVRQAVRRAQPTSERLAVPPLPGESRVDPMFLRWPLYRISVAGRDFVIPFLVYDADAMIVHGHATNYDFLQEWTRRMGGDYHPAFWLDGRKRVGFAELWIVTYKDTVGGPYREVVINYVVSKRRARQYRWRNPYSSLVPMMDSDNRLFTIRLLVDELGPVNQGPIRYGNELFGTDKRPARIDIRAHGQRRAFTCSENGVKTLWGDADFSEPTVQNWLDNIELTRELGLVAAVRNTRQMLRGDELKGGLVTPDFRDNPLQRTNEILASYKFNPTLSVQAASGFGYLRQDAPADSFAALLGQFGFEPQIAALDPHLKTVLFLENWPGATPVLDEDPLPVPRLPNGNPVDHSLPPGVSRAEVLPASFSSLGARRTP